MFSADDWNEFWVFLESRGVPIEGSQRVSLESNLSLFLDLLLKKNEMVNLTAIREPRDALWKHLADSLTLAAQEPLGILLDWGSGGGFPGIPIALFRRALGRPEPVFFLDSVGKKIRAIEEFCGELGLSSSRFFYMRGEAFLKECPEAKMIESVVMRAVAPPEEIVAWLDKKIPQWFVMGGPNQSAAWAGVQSRLKKRGFSFREGEVYGLPHDAGDRILFQISSKRST